MLIRKASPLSIKTMVCGLVLAACLCVESYADEVICCGNREVWMYDVDTKTGKRSERVWSWTESDSPNVINNIKGRFRCPDECKPIRKGEYILITSSAGGVAIIHRQTKKATFWAVVRNAHSADLLPKNRILVAGSSGADKLVLFDEGKPKQALWSDECNSCHGVVWDPKRQRVYALGSRIIQVYKLKDWDTDTPSLTRVENIQMPAGGGHDMFPVPNSSKLSISTGRNVWLFDRDTKQFELHPVIPNMRSVKSVNHHPVTGQVMYTKATIPRGSNTYELQFRNPDYTIELDQKTYKARWNIQLQSPDPNSLQNMEYKTCVPDEKGVKPGTEGH